MKFVLLEVYKNWLEADLSNLSWTEYWAFIDESIELETSWAPSLSEPEWFCVNYKL